MGLTARVREAAREPDGLLVLFHGRGADEHDLYPLLDYVDPSRRLLGVTPRGPLSLPPGGAHWYRLGEIGRPEPQTFLATYGEASMWLDELAETTGIPPARTILGGFSQGAVITYALGLGSGRPRPAAMLALSGFMPQVDGFDLDLSSQPLPRVAVGHGSFDGVIGPEWGRQAKAALEAAGAEVRFRESPLPHAIDPRYLAEVAPWLLAVVDSPARQKEQTGVLATENRPAAVETKTPPPATLPSTSNQ